MIAVWNTVFSKNAKTICVEFGAFAVYLSHILSLNQYII